MSNEYDDTNKLLARALARCANGDHSALSIIYKNTAAKFTAVVKADVDSSETTREILKRSYLSIWLNAPKYDSSRATPFTWMLVVLRSCASDVRQESSPAHSLHHEAGLKMGL